ncbi:MAG: hypothetical protein H7Z37_13805 [Pyrinomonadaceae bacterium]|nr:hypothetical protein [Pyrinomonadaceae bacterium]
MEFQTGVINPIQCFQEGWELIKAKYWLFFGISIVGMLVAGFVPFGIVLGAMFCGIYFALAKQADGENVEFTDLFKGFNYFLPGLVVSLLVIIPSFVFGVGLQIASFSMQFAIQGKTTSPEQAQAYLWTFLGIFGIVMLAWFLILGCLQAALIFAYPLVVDRKMSGWEAVKLSSRAVMANLGGVIGLITVEFLLSVVGLFLCYVGMFFILPVCFAGVFVAYRKVFPSINQPSNYPPMPPKFVNSDQWQ